MGGLLSDIVDRAILMRSACRVIGSLRLADGARGAGADPGRSRRRARRATPASTACAGSSPKAIRRAPARSGETLAGDRASTASGRQARRFNSPRRLQKYFRRLAGNIAGFAATSADPPRRRRAGVSGGREAVGRRSPGDAAGLARGSGRGGSMPTGANGRGVADPEIRDAARRRAELHRARFWRRAARQPLSADDREGGEGDARRRVGVRLPILRYRAALRPRAVRDPPQRFPAAEAARLLPHLHEGRPPARPLRAAGTLAPERLLRDAVAPRALRLFLRRRHALARALARAPGPRLDRHRVRPRRRSDHARPQGRRRLRISPSS